ncbi:PE domain-containing protein [Mycobacterium sp. CVI_P3]|uniref:PE domain-containing protein n=1 Tax=Mycobacterium pinniadriaticum TaxID=2994102 RepID=A0ABT3SJY0_9MYCO|nr:PE domain-containing protein [Mycobacterium pinniadriaticum]MCX2933421.1 PE domain-containing protein [Mycobacterium pinniadriaticum]MCX2939843.1 PE domain-containing protein [Mycobacterium pinniadriaticum]
MTLEVVPEGLAAASAAVDALSARLAATHAAAAPLIAAVVPPAGDAVSLNAALTCGAKGSAHTAAAAEGVLELARAGMGVAQSGASYAAGDLQGAATYGRQGVC